MAIKQYVPSAVCLKCDGCCRFDLSDSPWRPRVGEAESLADATDLKGYLPTKPLGERHQCVYFNATDFTCGVYEQRPFECALYPFVLSLEDNVIKCYVHLACPHVLDTLRDPKFTHYVAYLQDWFQSKSVRLWLEDNRRLLHDYRHAAAELDYVLTVSYE